MTLKSDSPQISQDDTWVFICPEGNEYEVGDKIPLLRAAEGLIFGEEVVRVPCPGFKGMRICNAKTEKEHTEEEGLKRGCCTKIDALQPDPNVFFVGPESQAWRWEYARVEIMRVKAFNLHDQKMIIKAFQGLSDVEDDLQ